MGSPDHPAGDGIRTPVAALAALRAGHHRYVTGRPSPPAAPFGPVTAPVAAIFGCADPQPAAASLFDSEVFVVRTVGLTLGPAVLASLEYAVGQLCVPLVVVLGHDACRHPGGTGARRVRRTVGALRHRSTMLDRAVANGRCAVVGMSWREATGLVQPVPRRLTDSIGRPAPVTGPPDRRPVRSA